MNIVQIYKKFPDQEACIKHLEQVRWGGVPTCPYCTSTKATPVPKESRYHCYSCRTSFSVTVGTVFHKTHMDFQLWFLMMSLMMNALKSLSGRQMARDLGIARNTALLNMRKLRKAMIEHEWMGGIVEVDETYIGGKEKNKHSNKRSGHAQGGSGKTAIIGLLERGKEVKAKVVPSTHAKELLPIVLKNLPPNTILMTDQNYTYRRLKGYYKHFVVNHGIGEYVRNGNIHTNSIEGFWSLFKRSIIGVYHYVSPKHLQKYVDEMSFRYNTRTFGEGARVNQLLLNSGHRLTYNELIKN